MISAYQPQGKLLTLVRNRYFRQWSFAAQPVGYPDVITWRVNPDAHAQIDAVVTGRADATYGLTGSTNATPQQISALAADLFNRHAAQFHPELEWTVSGEGMNLRVPPFNDVRVRRALNYAVDRQKIVAIEGGAGQAEVTCQVLPPGFPGHQPYCPYTTPPLDGTYHGPDPAKAKQLIPPQDKGMRVTVWRLADSPPISSYLVTVLNQLGFHATERVLHDTPAGYGYIYWPVRPDPAQLLSRLELGLPHAGELLHRRLPRLPAKRQLLRLLQPTSGRIREAGAGGPDHRPDHGKPAVGSPRRSTIRQRRWRHRAQLAS